MGRLAGFSADEIIRKLRRAGFHFDRQAKGGHEIWRHPISRARMTLEWSPTSRRAVASYSSCARSTSRGSSPTACCARAGSEAATSSSSGIPIREAAREASAAPEIRAFGVEAHPASLYTNEPLIGEAYFPMHRM